MIDICILKVRSYRAVPGGKPWSVVGIAKGAGMIGVLNKCNFKSLSIIILSKVALCFLVTINIYVHVRIFR